MLSVIAYHSLWPVNLPSRVPKKHHLDWVAQQEGKDGAGDTMSGTDQSAGLPNPEGCFTMDMC